MTPPKAWRRCWPKGAVFTTTKRALHRRIQSSSPIFPVTGSLSFLANVGGLGLNSAVAHHVGGLYNVPHGEANAILLPHTMRFNLDACAERQALIAQAMGIDTSAMRVEEAGLAAADAVAALCRDLGLPARLRDVDVPEEGLERIAAATLHDRGLATNPKPISDAAPILSVLHKAW